MIRPALDRYFYHQRYVQVRGLLDRYARGSRRVLDVGCGFGGNTAYLRHALGARAVGMDIDSLKLVEACRRAEGGGVGGGCAFICADAAHPPFRSASFDCILMAEVLEHLLSPAAGLDACHRLLVEGGLLVLTTPGSHNLDYSNNPFILVEKLLSLVWDHFLPPYHNLHAEREFNRRDPEPEYGIHYHFSVQEMETLLNAAGFETIQRGSFEFEIFPYLLVEYLSGGDLAIMERWIAPMERALQVAPVVKYLGQHLTWVARKVSSRELRAMV